MTYTLPESSTTWEGCISHSVSFSITLVNKKNQGIAGLLLAHVAQDAFNRGFEGFMMCLSKTALLDYYVRRYGCSRIANTNRVMFHTAACQLLIDRFLKEGVDKP